MVKKPKLDQHRTRCHGGFDCIDCSTTFNSPAEYKGHISCISEAEKYQKSLYKGPKTVRSWGRGGFSGRGGRGRFGGRGGWGQPSARGTGANDTPLGTLKRMGQPSARGTGANDTPLGTPNRMSRVTQPTPAPRERGRDRKSVV